MKSFSMRWASEQTIAMSTPAASIRSRMRRGSNGTYGGGASPGRAPVR
jgi:hypothetical protein